MSIVSVSMSGGTATRVDLAGGWKTLPENKHIARREIDDSFDRRREDVIKAPPETPEPKSFEAVCKALYEKGRDAWAAVHVGQDWFPIKHLADPMGLGEHVYAGQPWVLRQKAPAHYAYAVTLNRLRTMCGGHRCDDFKIADRVGDLQLPETAQRCRRVERGEETHRVPLDASLGEWLDQRQQGSGSVEPLQSGVSRGRRAFVVQHTGQLVAYAAPDRFKEAKPEWWDAVYDLEAKDPDPFVVVHEDMHWYGKEDAKLFVDGREADAAYKVQVEGNPHVKAGGKLVRQNWDGTDQVWDLGDKTLREMLGDVEGVYRLSVRTTAASEEAPVALVGVGGTRVVVETLPKTELPQWPTEGGARCYICSMRGTTCMPGSGAFDPLEVGANETVASVMSRHLPFDVNGADEVYAAVTKADASAFERRDYVGAASKVTGEELFSAVAAKHGTAGLVLSVTSKEATKTKVLFTRRGFEYAAKDGDFKHPFFAQRYKLRERFSTFVEVEAIQGVTWAVPVVSGATPDEMEAMGLVPPATGGRLFHKTQASATIGWSVRV